MEIVFVDNDDLREIYHGALYTASSLKNSTDCSNDVGW